jgi:hypothetical protein
VTPPKATRVCPTCRKPDGLWRDVMVPGWEAVDVAADGTATPNHRGAPNREVDWSGYVEETGSYGCSHCQWEGVKTELVSLGWDGEPLPTVSARQETLDV